MTLIEAARSLVGAPFRAQGRDPAIGLDCLGLIIASFGLEAPTAAYRLRGDHRRWLIKEARPWFRKVSKGQARCGDVLLLQSGPRQLHLAILGETSFIHADAGLKRVVETPGLPPWPILDVLRRRKRKLKD